MRASMICLCLLPLLAASSQVSSISLPNSLSLSTLSHSSNKAVDDDRLICQTNFTRTLPDECYLGEVISALISLEADADALCASECVAALVQSLNAVIDDPQHDCSNMFGCDIDSDCPEGNACFENLCASNCTVNADCNESEDDENECVEGLCRVKNSVRSTQQYLDILNGLCVSNEVNNCYAAYRNFLTNLENSEEGIDCDQLESLGCCLGSVQSCLLPVLLEGDPTRDDYLTCLLANECPHVNFANTCGDPETHCQAEAVACAGEIFECNKEFGQVFNCIEAGAELFTPSLLSQQIYSDPDAVFGVFCGHPCQENFTAAIQHFVDQSQCDVLTGNQGSCRESEDCGDGDGCFEGNCAQICSFSYECNLGDCLKSEGQESGFCVETDDDTGGDNEDDGPNGIKTMADVLTIANHGCANNEGVNCIALALATFSDGEPDCESFASLGCCTGTLINCVPSLFDITEDDVCVSITAQCPEIDFTQTCGDEECAFICAENANFLCFENMLAAVEEVNDNCGSVELLDSLESLIRGAEDSVIRTGFCASECHNATKAALDVALVDDNCASFFRDLPDVCESSEDCDEGEQCHEGGCLTQCNSDDDCDFVCSDNGVCEQDVIPAPIVRNVYGAICTNNGFGDCVDFVFAGDKKKQARAKSLSNIDCSQLENLGCCLDTVNECFDFAIPSEDLCVSRTICGLPQDQDAACARTDCLDAPDCNNFASVQCTAAFFQEVAECDLETIVAIPRFFDSDDLDLQGLCANLTCIGHVIDGFRAVDALQVQCGSAFDSLFAKPCDGDDVGFGCDGDEVCFSNICVALCGEGFDECDGTCVQIAEGFSICQEVIPYGLLADTLSGLCSQNNETFCVEQTPSSEDPIEACAQLAEAGCCATTASNCLARTADENPCNARKCFLNEIPEQCAPFDECPEPLCPVEDRQRECFDQLAAAVTTSSSGTCPAQALFPFIAQGLASLSLDLLLNDAAFQPMLAQLCAPPQEQGSGSCVDAMIQTVETLDADCMTLFATSPCLGTSDCPEHNVCAQNNCMQTCGNDGDLVCEGSCVQGLCVPAFQGPASLQGMKFFLTALCSKNDDDQFCLNAANFLGGCSDCCGGVLNQCLGVPNQCEQDPCGDIVCSESPTPSVSPSPSENDSVTASISDSASVTPSISVTSSETASISITPSISVSSSVTPSTTISVSRAPAGRTVVFVFKVNFGFRLGGVTAASLNTPAGISRLRAAIAARAGVSVDSVVIISIVDSSDKAVGATVNSQITTDSQADADSTASTVTSDAGALLTEIQDKFSDLDIEGLDDATVSDLDTSVVKEVVYEEDKDDDSLSDGEIAGIIIGSVGGALLIGAIACMIMKKPKGGNKATDKVLL